MRVRFTVTDTPYQAGSEYDLPAGEAKKFIRHKVAVQVGKESKPVTRKVTKKR
jgi:hypothetical protein